MTVDIDITVHISDANEKNFIKDAGSKFKVLVDNPDEFVKKTRVLPINITENVRGDIIFTGLEYEKMAIERAVEGILLRRGALLDRKYLILKSLSPEPLAASPHRAITYLYKSCVASLPQPLSSTDRRCRRGARLS